MAQTNNELANKISSKNNLPPTSGGFENTLRTWLYGQGNIRRFNNLFGSEAEAKKYIVSALECFNRTPALRNCNFNNIVTSLLDCASLKLYLGGAFGEAALLPFKDKCQLVIQYQGFAKLLYNSGFITGLWAEVVREGDEFDYNEGLNRNLHHKRKRAPVEDRGERIAVYSCWKTIHGNTDFYLMFPEEIEAIKRRSPSAGTEYSPWNADKKGNYSDADWMWKKCPIKQGAKLLPKSPELIRAMEVDENISPTIDAGSIDPQALLDPPKEDPAVPTDNSSKDVTP